VTNGFLTILPAEWIWLFTYLLSPLFLGGFTVFEEI